MAITVEINRHYSSYREDSSCMKDYLMDIQNKANNILKQIGYLSASHITYMLDIPYVPPGFDYWNSMNEGWDSESSKIVFDITEEIDPEGYSLYKIKLNCSPL